MSKTASLKKSKKMNLTLTITSVSAVLGGLIGFIACLNYLKSGRYSLSSIIQYMFGTWSPWVLAGLVIGGVAGYLFSLAIGKRRR